MTVEDHHPLLRSRATINPYRTAAGRVLDRLGWDLNSESSRSRVRRSALRDAHKGERAVMLCNAPSLNRVIFDLLKGVFCFGLNKINLLFNRSNFRPNAVVAVNPLVIEQNADFFNSTGLPLFISKVGLGHVQPKKNVAFLQSSNMVQVARNVSIGLYEGLTVTYVALQPAFHMGFQQVAFVGADHTFASKGPAKKTAIAVDVDEGHFDPRYFPGRVQWQLPDLSQSEVGYIVARDSYADSGGRAVNATTRGGLEPFDRMNLAAFVMDSSRRRALEGCAE